MDKRRELKSHEKPKACSLHGYASIKHNYGKPKTIVNK
jgi:hypothetical protein